MVEPMAYGALNLNPREFDRLQPQEFEKLLEGYAWRSNRHNELMAYFTYWIVAPHVKKNAVTIEKILNPLKPKQAKKEISEGDKDYFRKMAKELGGV
jgi:hypothetical protein